MEEKDEKLLAGSLGNFWDNVKLGEFATERGSGYINKLSDGNVQLEYFLDPEGASDEAYTLPQCVYGATVNGRVLLVDFLRSNRTLRSHGLPSVRTQTAGTAIFGALPEHVNLDTLRSVTAFFPGITEWSGMQTITEKARTDERSRGKSVALHVESAPRQQHALPHGRQLALSSHWRLEGNVDNRSVFAPVSLTCSAKKSSAFRDLLQPLIQIQDILNIAHGGFVPARGGRVEFAADENPDTHPRFWSTRIMQASTGVPAREPMNRIPLFELDDIGGIPGLARWVKFCETVPRVHRALTLRYRVGAAGVEARFLEVAAAIEYWVASQDRGGVKWSQEKRRPLALAKLVGKAFSDWVGDAEEWDDVFAGTYNAVKHDPAFVPDPYAISYLAESGWILLLSATLNRISANKAPGRIVIGNHRYSGLGGEIRDLLVDPNAHIKRREKPRRKRKRGRSQGSST
ncbi:ApeA N-terminal domain 1-containing protein [Streptomyces kronopolitis]